MENKRSHRKGAGTYTSQVLKNRQKKELWAWLNDNHASLAADSCDYSETASRATAALGFVVTVHHVRASIFDGCVPRWKKQPVRRVRPVISCISPTVTLLERIAALEQRVALLERNTGIVLVTAN
jgi:hypothetical protein